MNWRAVRLRTLGRDVVIIPNSLMGKEVAVNYTLLDPLPHMRLLGYGYDKVAVNYEVKLYTADYSRTEFIRDEVLTRIYYTAQRYNFIIPPHWTIQSLTRIPEPLAATMTHTPIAAHLMVDPIRLNGARILR